MAARHWLIITLLIGLLGPAAAEPAPGSSPDEQAQRLSDEAVELYRQGQYEAALPLFQQAFALRADPTLLYNLARTFEKLKKREPALEYYRRYLIAEGTDPKLRTRAEEKIKLLGRANAPAQPSGPLKKPPRPGALMFYSGIGLAALGLVGMIAGAALFGVASGEYRNFQGSPDEFDKRAARDRVQMFSTGGTVSSVLGAALLAGGGTLVGLALRRGFWRREGRPAARVALYPLQHGGAVLFAGEF